MTLQQQIFNYIDKISNELTDIRRHLHMHPELSHQEVKTPEFIANYLKIRPLCQRRFSPFKTNAWKRSCLQKPQWF